MLENLLPDQLALPVAIGGQPNTPGRPQSLPDCLELGGFVASARRAGAVKPFRPEENGRPLLPCRHNVSRLEQIEKMALGREDRPVTQANGSTDILCLAGFLGDDNLIRHAALAVGMRLEAILSTSTNAPARKRCAPRWLRPRNRHLRRNRCRRYRLECAPWGGQNGRFEWPPFLVFRRLAVMTKQFQFDIPPYI